MEISNLVGNLCWC